MKKILLIVVPLIMACSANGDFARPANSDADVVICEFDFYRLEECAFEIDQKVVTIGLKTIQIADGERELSHLKVDRDSETLYLPVSSGTSLIEGDRGYILFEDINFDQRADLAVTTSFGVANLYLDYWTISENAEHFNYAGNFPRLTMDQVNRTLSAEERVNATSYQKTTWHWEDGELVLQASSKSSSPEPLSMAIYFDPPLANKIDPPNRV